MSDKMLDKVSKLLAQAENAGTPEEAATFMEKVQALAAANSIDLAVARMHQAQKERVQIPEERRIVVNPWERRHNRKHFMDLAMMVAGVNDVKYLISGREYALLAVGFPSDLDVVTALYTHLSVQMQTECDAALKRGENKGIRSQPKRRRVPITPEGREEWIANLSWERENAWYDGRIEEPTTMLEDVRDANGNRVFEDTLVSLVDGRVFRNEFYSAFIPRMGSRLWEAKREAQKAAGVDLRDATNERGLAIRNKTEEVAKADEERRAKIKHLGSYSGASSDERQTDHTGLGSAHGRKSAERVAIGDSREIG